MLRLCGDFVDCTRREMSQGSGSRIRQFPGRVKSESVGVECGTVGLIVYDDILL